MREAARNPMAFGSGGGGAASSVRRIQRELKEITESPSRHWMAAPANDDLFEWQFAIRGPPATDFEGGIYTGRLVLPVNYPLAPPSIMLLTPNGRWEVGKKICLSNSNYHPELWQPAWGIRTMMEALRSHFPVPGDGAIGALDWPSDLRRKLAKESLDFVCGGQGNKKNRELLPELSPEEIAEDGEPPRPPEPPSAAAADAPPAATSPAAAVVAAPAPGSLQAAPAPAPTPLAPAAAQAASVAPAAPAVAVPAATVGAAAAVGNGGVRQRRVEAAPTEPNRSRRENPGNRAPRRGQSIFSQLLQLPSTKRGLVTLMINVGILGLTVSLVATLADMARNPPELLDPLPGTGL
eukprot:TRINITY_DN16080_c0_g1_i1.p1 TRINITY_DN16080_c0_g1~~TRINITY_DN16080_c0_g1_i1.p1  ORF type:complete len:351 (-),score=78.67 TRINITY_DN16080_c0_g1_i1:122-1174(-)